MTDDKKSKLHEWGNRLFGDNSTVQKYPKLNAVILLYVAVSTVCYVLFLIAPFVTFIARTPLYHMQSYLGVLGGALVCVDLLTNRGIWRGPYCVLLYGMCALALLASARTLSYGVKDNIFIIAWTVVQFALFYSCACRMDRQQMRQYVGRLYAAVMPIWFAACCVSVYQYVFQIGYLYVVDPLAEDLSVARQGFLESRLFGIFNPLNHAAYVSLMLLAAGIYYAARTRHRLTRAALVVVNVMFFFHVILSGSRSAELSLLICAFFAAFAAARGRIADPGFQRAVRSAGIAVLCLCICLGVFLGTKDVLGQVPRVMESGGLISEEIVEDVDLLERMDLEDNTSNNRLGIWKDYVDLRGEIGLIGLSPGNYMGVIRDRHPNMYIVKYIRENFPEKYAAGSIYHVHNGYLMAWVSAGLAGLLCALAFLVLCCRRAVRYMLRRPQVSWSYITLCAIVGMGCIAAFFDKALFFMDSAPTFFFWLALGMLMKESEPEEGSEVRI